MNEIMNPYYQPMRNNYYVPMYQPQPQMPTVQNGIAGRIVNDFAEITANDVPMDGRSAFFPKGDMSEILVKNWGADGSIRTMTFKPVISQPLQNVTTETQKPDNEPFNAFLGVFEERMKELNSKLDKLGKPKSRKESDDE